MADILIVDDNAAFRKMLKHILFSRFPSMHVSEAHDGNRAIKEIENKRLISLLWTCDSLARTASI